MHDPRTNEARRQARSVGLGFRAPYVVDLLRHRPDVALLEIVAEACSDERHLRAATAMGEAFPLVLHGIRASLGSADGLDEERAARLGALSRSLRARLVTEHVAFVRTGESRLPHLVAVPFSRAAVSVVARNTTRLRRKLPDVPFALENIAWTMRLPGDEMSEGTFYHEVVHATGCPLLLDVANVYANARNAGGCPFALLASYPLEHVAMMHVAGGRPDPDGFYVDSHAHPMPEEIDALVAAALHRTGEVPVVLERDEALPPFAELRCELERLRQIRPALESLPRQEERPVASLGRASSSTSDAATRALLMAQRELASLLDVRRDLDAYGSAARGYDSTGLRRTRRILAHKARHDTKGGIQ